MNADGQRIFRLSLPILLIASLPYLIAWAATPADAHFTGLLLNPLDGNSYLAKMRLGLDGHLRFRLTFTPEAQKGAYLYIVQILLGHLSRYLRLPLIATYHLARVLAGLLLLIIAHRFARFTVGPAATTAWGLLAVASGFGYLTLSVGHPTPDLLIPEAFVLPSLLETFHFPLAVAMMLLILMSLAHPGGPTLRETFRALVASLLLGIVQPFGVAPVYTTLALWSLLRWLRDRRFDRRAAALIVLAGLTAALYPAYSLIAFHTDPVLSGWLGQNQTPSPPLWEWPLAFGLLTPLALVGGIPAARRRSDTDLLLLSWVSVVFVEMYLPFSLQRRLSLGLAVPVSLLAALGWRQVVIPRIKARRRRLATAALLGFSAIGNLFLMAGLTLNALSGDPLLYLTDGEWTALAYLRRAVSHDRVVLCSPRMGMFVPAWAGQAVVYGHPFETVDADRRRAQVETFLSGAMPPAERETFLRENRVDYLLLGPRESERVDAGAMGTLLFVADEMEIWRLGD